MLTVEPAQTIHTQLQAVPLDLKVPETKFPAAWALLASLAVHSFGFGSYVLQVPDLISSWVTQRAEQSLPASQLPVVMVESNNLSLNAAAKQNKARQEARFTWVDLPPTLAKLTKPAEKTTLESKPKSVTKPSAVQQPKPVPNPVSENPIVLASNDAQPVPVNADKATGTVEPIASVNNTPAAPATSADTANTSAAPETSTAAISGANQTPTLDAAANVANADSKAPAGNPRGSYQLPQEVRVRYETNYQGYPARSELHWKKLGDAGALRYEAALFTSALGMEHRFKSLGIIGIKGLAPRSAEEKRPFKSAIATSVEPENNRVIISSKEGFLPYDPLGHDLVSLMIQLGIYAQSLPEWSRPGVAQDFTVYRPSGVRRWRFQSQGLDNLTLKGETRPMVYIKRIAADGQADYEDQYHFWLDPQRYGFPVKMRQVDNKGKITDILMTDWRE